MADVGQTIYSRRLCWRQKIHNLWQEWVYVILKKYVANFDKKFPQMNVFYLTIPEQWCSKDFINRRAGISINAPHLQGAKDGGYILT